MSDKWTLPKMKDLSRYKRVIVDTETNGLNHWDSRTIGTAVGFVHDDGTVESNYYPYGHDGGKQYSRADVVGWLNTELRNKELIFHNAAFDVIMLLQDGLDLRQHNNTIHDTMIKSILLDPSDWYSLDHCVHRYVDPNISKLELPFPKDQMQFYPSHDVGLYAEADVSLTHKLDLKTEPLMKKKDLGQIYRLECDCLSPTIEMMNNGLIIDTDKLSKNIAGLKKKVNALTKKMGTVNPNSGKDLLVEFQNRNIPVAHNYKCSPCSEQMKRDIAWPSFTQPICPYCKSGMEEGSAHFGQQLMAQLDHPFVKQIRELKKNKRLLDAFMIPWSEQLKHGRILPFQLNQLRDRKYDGSTKGTVTGRYSSEMYGGGSQPQQIWSAEKQIEELGDEYILRELFIASNPDLMFGSVDASQIEFRLLGHFAKTDKIAAAYNKDPFIDYHTLVQTVILESLITRKKAKNVNFGKIYGMGLGLFSRTMNIPFEEAKELYDLYEAKLPEAKETSQYWERQARVRGQIRTLRGRLFEFGPKDKTHIAMSRLIQGSAGDLMKEALIKLYRANMFEKLRCTVHDEALGCIDPSKGLQLVELLNDVVGLRVPLRWKLSISKNWAMTGPETIEIPSKEDIKRFQAA